ncbi:MAG: EamA family transporter [Clostridia bacterium]|nr:EamA family transporter [Clostridia bacterium]
MLKINKFVLLHLLLFLFSFCAVFSKLAAQNQFLSLKFVILYGISILILGIYAILWQQILKKFDLTTAFFNKAVVVIWGMIWGAIFFKEQITIKMIIGVIIVLIGVSLVVKADE